MQSFRQLIGKALHVAGCCALLASLCARSCAGDVVQARLQGPAPDAAEDPAALRLPEGPVATLDGTWLLSTDPSDTGREQRWFEAPRAGSKPSNVPWIIQEAFPGYHGVAWYWRDFVPSTNTYASGRSLLRFWAVDFSAEVWLNGIRVGAHEGGETPFLLDVTDVLKVNGTNRLAVRVVNPTHRPIDGLTLNQTPRQARVIPYSAGAAYDCGGITESVELLSVPVVRIEELHALPDPKTGVVHIRSRFRNASKEMVRGSLEWIIAPAADGELLGSVMMDRDLQPGRTQVDTDLIVAPPHLWDINDPYLYRVTARLTASQCLDERSVRCGFRDFRFENGYFRLNGRRIFLRSSHTCNHFPVGQRLPYDKDLARRDLLDVKVMGFNTIRFIWGGAERYQLDLCDEIGLMVYEESFASMAMADSPKMAELFDSSVSELIRRDWNHPSIVIWGLLNEAGSGPAFRHATQMLPLVRSLDDSRMVFLNAGRYDGQSAEADGPFSKVHIWHSSAAREPWIVYNPLDQPVETPFTFAWPHHQVCLHPGENGEFSVARWTAQESGMATISASFTGVPRIPATTDVHVLHNGRRLFDSFLNLGGQPNSVSYSNSIIVAKGDTIDFVVGYGNRNYGGDTTALRASMAMKSGRTFDLAKDFDGARNPAGSWSYGMLRASAAPDASTLNLYTESKNSSLFGSISNPGSSRWEDLLTDKHHYPRVPHTSAIIHSLRSMRGLTPVFLSEYGIGSAVDLWRVTRHFEELGKTETEDARFYRDKLDRYLDDWRRWKLEDVFARPEDFFAESLRKMAEQRTLGINAIRSNPNIVGYSLTGMNDHVSCGEGLTTTFRELKPGTVDAMFEGFAPLRWCLFVGPVNVYRGTKVRLEAVLANEDVLRPSDYPVRIQVIGPDKLPVFQRSLTLHVSGRDANREPPLALPVFDQEVPVDGPAGKYRFLASLDGGGAPTGGETEFYVDDPASMPSVETEIVLWGEDPFLIRWLGAHKFKTRQFDPAPPREREVILAGLGPAAASPVELVSLAQHTARGSTAVFLSPEIFKKGENPTAWLPLVKKGSLSAIYGWLYLKDEWAKRHPIFAGLPSGGLMDYTFYREIIPDMVWINQDPPAEAVAGAIKASQGYSSGLMLAVYSFGSGRFILNTLLIRENLGQHPAAERLLRNLLRYAASETSKLPSELPLDFDSQLKLIGYR